MLAVRRLQKRQKQNRITKERKKKKHRKTKTETENGCLSSLKERKTEAEENVKQGFSIFNNSSSQLLNTTPF